MPPNGRRRAINQPAPHPEHTPEHNVIPSKDLRTARPTDHRRSIQAVTIRGWSSPTVAGTPDGSLISPIIEASARASWSSSGFS